jgi:hypothetical protein
MRSVRTRPPRRTDGNRRALRIIQRCSLGGVASPILSNIYLHKVDHFVETVLVPEYTRGRLRARNRDYRKVEQAIVRARRRGDRAEVRSLYRRLHSLPSQDPNDPGYRRLRYCRYADDTLLGFVGPSQSDTAGPSQVVAATARPTRLCTESSSAGCGGTQQQKTTTAQTRRRQDSPRDHPLLETLRRPRSIRDHPTGWNGDRARSGRRLTSVGASTPANCSHRERACDVS